MMQEQYLNGKLVKRWNETNKRVETMAADGVTVTSFVPMTTGESLAADAYIAKQLAITNETATKAAIGQDFLDMQTLINTTNSTINASPASYLKQIARAVRRLDRVALEKYDGTD